MSEEPVTIGTILDLCRDQYCRIAIRTLAEEQRSMTIDELSKVIFRDIYQTPITEASEDVLTDIRTSLYHAHLPKLAAKGHVTYDAERQLVEPTEQLTGVHSTLSTFLAGDSPAGIAD
ncbi:hypothetical protein Halru_1680 [Halovivax ruber XH-70]|uniref:DUF7344 domain-containing protein n=1 Tax=Halovivax ruber (strain DSM 18193 / JCM 13892 / XH-70) TaxID=797302 RepID=L0IDK8_HALRX|nr:hypothetical protein [Halovivax ruber]AGB16286.1 hypothetical protein Halru_1680 [Halovivax ruber XH-70]